MTESDLVGKALSGLAEFKARNPHCEPLAEGNALVLDKPFGEADSQFSFESPGQDIISDLNNIGFRAQFDALFHFDLSLVELIFGHVDPIEGRAKDCLDRDFQVTFQGQTHKCYYAEPTTRLYRLARGFKRINTRLGSGAGYQLVQFRDAQNLDKMPDRAKAYFQKHVPRSFFVQLCSPVNLADFDFESLAQHLNFIMAYFDRDTPEIVIREKLQPSMTEKLPNLRYVAGNFPKTVVLKKYDEVTLKLLSVAATSKPRIAFLYYYQIFEYAGFHYIDAKAKSGILKVLRDPAVLDNLSDKIGELFTVLADTAHNDETRMLKVIEDTCDPKVIWKEIESHKTFFSAEASFIGGFKSPALISSDTTVDAWSQMWTPKLFSQLTKIRNCLVHAREKRESKGILPNEENDAKLRYYVAIIRRVAEQIAFAGNEF